MRNTHSTAAIFMYTQISAASIISKKKKFSSTPFSKTTSNRCCKLSVWTYVDILRVKRRFWYNFTNLLMGRVQPVPLNNSTYFTSVKSVISFTYFRLPLVYVSSLRSIALGPDKFLRDNENDIWLLQLSSSLSWRTLI